MLIDQCKVPVQWKFIKTYLVDQGTISEKTYNTLEKVFAGNPEAYAGLVKEMGDGFFCLNASEHATIENGLLESEE